MLHVVRVHGWSLIWGSGRYYGYRWGVVIGPYMVLIWPIRGGGT